MNHISRKQLLEFQSLLNKAGVQCWIYETDAPYKYVFFDGEEHRCKTNAEAMDMLMKLADRLIGHGPQDELAAERKEH